MPTLCEYPVVSRASETTLHIVGHCEYLNCVPLRKFLDFSVERAGHSQIILEFSGCLSIDSTALGLIAKAALLIRKSTGRKIILANLTKGPRHAVIQLGLPHLAQIEEMPEHLDRATAIAPSSSDDDCVDRRTIREAHEALMEIAPGNRTLFADVMTFIGTMREARA